MINNYLVSIFIPVYNGEKYLNETIQSVLHQTYSNIELLSQYINDGFFLTVDIEPKPLVPLNGATSSIESSIKEMNDDELLALINSDIQKYT